MYGGNWEQEQGVEGIHEKIVWHDYTIRIFEKEC
jgi:hypothetical protein